MSPGATPPPGGSQRLAASGPLPVIRPEPPRLSEHLAALAAIEERGLYTNYGPLNTELEAGFIAQVFGGEGHCVTVCNATIGLMMAIRDVMGEFPDPARRYALMPSFTFAAAAQAALWCGLTPLLCDIDPNTWLPDAEHEESLLTRYAGGVAVIVPYATFGNDLDLDRYARLAETYRVPVVVDAAASLGSLDRRGRTPGQGFPWPVIFSMHATKLFATGEGGLLYCADPERIARLRTMGSFGFGEARSATALGLNSKLSEVAALTALLQLERFPEVVAHRVALADRYTQQLSTRFTLQQSTGQRQARTFQSVLLPRELAPARAHIADALRARGIGSGSYFSPHLAEQPFLQRHSVIPPLPHTEEVASRVLTLPLLAGMIVEDVDFIAAALSEVADTLGSATPPNPLASRVTEHAWTNSPDLELAR